MHKIFIVEDDTVIASAIAKHLKTWGCETRCADDLQNVLAASDNFNIIMAMNMGGDDFISKPFDMNVLTAKVFAILRRTYDFGASSGLLEHKGAILNTGDATLTYNDEKIDLTKNDYRILLTLMENKGKVVSRDTLMTRLWETDCYVDENTLTVNITRLRKKLEAGGLKDFIQTKKGIGYIIP